MAFSWRFFGPDGEVVDDDPALAAPTSTSQGDAESWLGEQWRDLAGRGIASATLLEDDRVVYGPMPLAE